MQPGTQAYVDDLLGTASSNLIENNHQELATSLDTMREFLGMHFHELIGDPDFPAIPELEQYTLDSVHDIYNLSTHDVVDTKELSAILGEWEDLMNGEVIRLAPDPSVFQDVISVLYSLRTSITGDAEAEILLEEASQTERLMREAFISSDQLSVPSLRDADASLVSEMKSIEREIYGRMLVLCANAAPILRREHCEALWEVVALRGLARNYLLLHEQAFTE